MRYTEIAGDFSRKFSLRRDSVDTPWPVTVKFHALFGSGSPLKEDGSPQAETRSSVTLRPFRRVSGPFSVAYARWPEFLRVLVDLPDAAAVAAWHSHAHAPIPPVRQRRGSRSSSYGVARRGRLRQGARRARAGLGPIPRRIPLAPFARRADRGATTGLEAGAKCHGSRGEGVPKELVDRVSVDKALCGNGDHFEQVQ